MANDAATVRIGAQTVEEFLACADVDDTSAARHITATCPDPKAIWRADRRTLVRLAPECGDYLALAQRLHARSDALGFRNPPDRESRDRWIAACLQSIWYDALNPSEPA